MKNNSEGNLQKVSNKKRNSYKGLFLSVFLATPVVFTLSIIIYMNVFLYHDDLCVNRKYIDGKSIVYCYENLTEKECLGKCDGNFLQYKYLYNIGNCNYLCNGIGQDYYNSACRERNNQF